MTFRSDIVLVKIKAYSQRNYDIRASSIAPPTPAIVIDRFDWLSCPRNHRMNAESNRAEQSIPSDTARRDRLS